MSSARELAPYAALHERLGLAPHLFIARVSDGLLRPASYAARMDAALAPLLRAAPAPLFIHLFSDNGFIALSRVLEVLDRGPAGRRVRAALSGIVLDSSPGLHSVTSAAGFADRFARGTTPFVAKRLGLRPREHVAGLTPLLRAVFRGYHAVSRGGVERMLSASGRVAAHDARVKELYLVGEADTLVTVDDVERYASARRALGVSPRVVRFPGARHVALLPSDPSRYEAEIEAFVRA